MWGFGTRRCSQISDSRSAYLSRLRSNSSWSQDSFCIIELPLMLGFSRTNVWLHCLIGWMIGAEVIRTDRTEYVDFWLGFSRWGSFTDMLSLVVRWFSFVKALVWYVRKCFLGIFFSIKMHVKSRTGGMRRFQPFRWAVLLSIYSFLQMLTSFEMKRIWQKTYESGCYARRVGKTMSEGVMIRRSECSHLYKSRHCVLQTSRSKVMSSACCVFLFPRYNTQAYQILLQAVGTLFEM